MKKSTWISNFKTKREIAPIFVAFSEYMNFLYKTEQTHLIGKWNSTWAKTLQIVVLWWNLGRILILNLTSSTSAFWFARYNSSTDSLRGISYRDNYELQNFQGLWDGISGQLVCVHVQNQSIWLETKFWYVSVCLKGWI